VEKEMKELCIEGLATHDDLEELVSIVVEICPGNSVI
jgi:hypothetical protein